MGVRGFGIAQISYSLTHLFVMVMSTKGYIFNSTVENDDSDVTATCISAFLPRTLPTPSSPTHNHDIATNNTDIGKKTANFQTFINPYILHFIDPKTAYAALNATFSSLLKHLLTESDKIALSLTTSSYDQGIFALTNNYGSLVTRIVFLPIEDSSRLIFSKLASDINNGLLDVNSKVDGDISTCNIGSDSSISDGVISDKSSGSIEYCKNQLKSIEQRVIGDDNNDDLVGKVVNMDHLLAVLLQFVVSIGIVFLVFGPLYSRLVVNLIFPRKWRTEETVKTLAAVSINVFVFALNGVTEAFIHAVAPISYFRQVNIGFFLGSCVYMISVSYMVSKLGTSGLMLASTMSMLIRIINSFHIIYNVLQNLMANTKQARCTKRNVLLGKKISQSSDPLLNANDTNKNHISNNQYDDSDVGISNRNSKFKMEYYQEDSYSNDAVLRKNKEAFQDYRPEVVVAIIPPLRVLFALIISWIMSYLSSNRYSKSNFSWRSTADHLGVGVVAFSILLSSLLWNSNTNQLKEMVMTFVRKSKEKTK